MKFKDDYASAGVPMLPVVAPAATVARKILVYSYLMVGATLALAPYAGWIYGCLRHWPRGLVPGRGPAAPFPCGGGEAAAPMRLFHLSIAYLTLLFAAIAVTALLPWRG